jgi:hypothetical protein
MYGSPACPSTKNDTTESLVVVVVEEAHAVFSYEFL